MGGEGSMAAANQSLKQNRILLRKRKFRDTKDLMRSYSESSTLEFEKIAPEDLSRIKQEIRSKAKREQKKRIIAYLISTSITVGILLLIFQYA